MTSLGTWVRDLVGKRAPPQRDRGVIAFDRAMQVSGELIERFQTASKSPDPIRAMFGDMWLARHNVPYVTSIFETHQEMMAPIEQQRKRNGKAK